MVESIYKGQAHITSGLCIAYLPCRMLLMMCVYFLSKKSLGVYIYRSLKEQLDYFWATVPNSRVNVPSTH